jgi:hypothetical protein
MVARSRSQFEKRRKELARQERQKEKRDRRLEQKERKTGETGDGPEEEEEEDPDIAGIRLGPQAPSDEAPPEQE